MNTIRITAADLALFRAASHDHNPLHYSEDYARTTPYGEPVVFGILGLLAALGASPLKQNAELAGISATFREPMYCGIDYSVAVTEKDNGDLKVVVSDAGRIVQTAAVQLRALDGNPSPVCCRSVVAPSNPALLGARELHPGFSVSGDYGPASEPFTRLLERFHLAGCGVPPGQVAALLWTSYLVGVQLPGERALFSQLRLTISSETASINNPLTYAARVDEFDDRFNLVTIGGTLYAGAVEFAKAEIAAFLRHDSPPVPLDALGRVLPRSDALSGRTALVTGGSRGLGAALTAALASQGAHVFLNYRSGQSEAAALRDALHDTAGRVSLLQGDASDASWCRQVQASLEGQGTGLDLLVCNAAPPLRNLGLGLESLDRARTFVDQSLALVYTPLAGFEKLLQARKGRVVLISSIVAASDAPEFPADWLHYVAAKSAVEGLVRAAAARANGIGYLIVRPPRLLTDQTNTPSGRQGAIAVERVAAAVTRRLCEPAARSLEVLDLRELVHRS